jgi:zinc protease
VRRADVINALAIKILKRRLSKIEEGARPPFLKADARYQTVHHSADAAIVTATSSPSGWRETLAAIDREQRRIVQYGVFQEELDREIAEYRATLERKAEGAATQLSGTLADELVQADDYRIVFTTPASYLALFEATVKNLKARVVNGALRRIFDGSGPAVAMLAAAPLPSSDAELATEYAKVHAMPVSAPAAEAAIVWPYGHFGTPSTVARRTAIPGLDATAVRFANGVRLNVKPTKFIKGEILVQVRVGNGVQDLPKDAPVWMQDAFIGGGLKALNLSDLARALAPNVAGASFSIGGGAFVFNGQTRPQDLGVQMQLLAAYVTDAGCRPEAVEQQRLDRINQHPGLEATATGVFYRDREALMRSGDPRWADPGVRQLQAARAEDLNAMLQGPLSSGAIEVTIVGDVTEEAAIKATAATFGALPARPDPRPVSQAEHITFPAPAAVSLTHKGRNDEAVASIAWPVSDFFADLRHSYALAVAVEVLNNRVTHQVREVDGATYSPWSETHLPMQFPGYGYISIMVETPPEKVTNFYRAVATIAADMREHGITPDELVRARTPMLETAKRNLLSNSTWIDYLSGSQGDPRFLDWARNHIPNLESVAAEDIRAVMTAYAADERAWKLTVLPAAGLHADAKLLVAP